MDDLLVRGLRDIAEHDGGAARILAEEFDSKIHQLEKYIAEIELFNDALGLVGTKDHRELVIRHILDSLSPLGTIVRLLESAVNNGDMTGPVAARGAVADVGSGAGLPGIPLAICLPRTPFVLIERSGRRAGFLRNAVAAPGFSNIEIEETEMERAAPGRFSVVVFRAFRPLESAVFRKLLRLAAPGGYLAAWKGRLKNAAAEISGLGALPPGISAEIIPSPVPFLDEERCLVTIGGPVPRIGPVPESPGGI